MSWRWSSAARAPAETRARTPISPRLCIRAAAVWSAASRAPDTAAATGSVAALFVAEHLAIPTLTIVLYDDLVHVDFDVVAADRAAEHNDGLPAIVLWEREPISDALPDRKSTRLNSSHLGTSYAVF